MTFNLVTNESSNTTIELSNSKIFIGIASFREHHKTLFDYTAHALLGSLVAVATFSVSLATQPKIADAYIPETYQMVQNVTVNDMNSLVQYMDANIMEVVDEELGSCSASQYLMAYVEEDPSFEVILTNYFDTI